MLQFYHTKVVIFDAIKNFFANFVAEKINFIESMADNKLPQDNAERPDTLTRIFRAVGGFFLTVLIIWLVYILRGVLWPFILACFIAYMLEPLVQLNRRITHEKGRIGAVFLTLLESTAVVILLLVILIPLLFSEFREILSLLGRYMSSAADGPLINAIKDFIADYIDLDYFKNMFTGNEWWEIVKSFFATTVGVISVGISVIMGIIGWFFIMIYLIFIMIDFNRFFGWLRSLVPKKYRGAVMKITSDVRESMNHYFRGQAIVAFIVGILFCIGFWIIGMPMAIALGIFIGFLNLVPYLQLISIIPTLILCVVYSVDTGGSFWIMFGEAMLVYIVIQIIQDFFLVPKIMGKAMGLNPVIILLSLSIWGYLLGFIGLIIALPMTTLLLSYYNKYVVGEKEKGKSESAAESESSATPPPYNPK